VPARPHASRHGRTVAILRHVVKVLRARRPVRAEIRDSKLSAGKLSGLDRALVWFPVALTKSARMTTLCRRVALAHDLGDGGEVSCRQRRDAQVPTGLSGGEHRRYASPINRITSSPAPSGSGCAVQ